MAEIFRCTKKQRESLKSVLLHAAIRAFKESNIEVEFHCFKDFASWLQSDDIGVECDASIPPNNREPVPPDDFNKQGQERRKLFLVGFGDGSKGSAIKYKYSLDYTQGYIEGSQARRSAIHSYSLKERLPHPRVMRLTDDLRPHSDVIGE